MNIPMLSRFFKWCTIINGGLLVFSALWIWLANDQVFGVHSHWIALAREQFNLAIYLLLGIFKLLVIVFNLVPYVALVIMSRHERQSSIP